MEYGMEYGVRVHEDHLAIEVGAGDAPQRMAGLLNAVAAALARSAAKPALISAAGGAPMRLVDLYVLARSLRHTPLKRKKIAFLYDAEGCLESSRFVESIAEENGLKLEVFGTRHEALRWLGRPDGDRVLPGRRSPLNALQIC